MKRFGLSLHLSSATLFLILGSTGAFAQPTATATKPPEDQMKRFDKDGDGQLDDAERAAAKVALRNEQPASASSSATSKPKRGSPEAMRGRMLEVFDTNKDGKLDDAERTAAKTAGAERGGAMRDELVKRFDKNGNGKLDGDERETAASFAKKRAGAGEKPGVSKDKPAAVATDAALEKAMRATVEADAAQLQRFDDDKDGKLSDQEWQAARKAIARMLGGA